MTTDDFTDALHADADGRYTTPGLRGVFAEGAYWARDYLAAQEPTDAEVLAAMAAYEGHATRVEAWRAALSAARAARRDEETTR